MFKLVLGLDVLDPETGEPFDSDMAKRAWFRRQYPNGLPSLADTVGDLLGRTGLAVTLMDDDAKPHDVVVKTVNYSTMVMVTRGQQTPFGELAIMSDDYADEELIEETV